MAIPDLCRVERWTLSKATSKHQPRLDLAHRAEAVDGVVADPAVQQPQLLVGEAEIGLADRHQARRPARRRTCSRNKGRPLAVTALRIHQHRVGGERPALPFEPRSLRAGRRDRRCRGASASAPRCRSRGPRRECGQLLPGPEGHQRRQVHALGPHARMPILQPPTALLERQPAQILTLGRTECRRGAHGPDSPRASRGRPPCD